MTNGSILFVFTQYFTRYHCPVILNVSDTVKIIVSMTLISYFELPMHHYGKPLCWSIMLKVIKTGKKYEDEKHTCAKSEKMSISLKSCTILPWIPNQNSYAELSSEQSTNWRSESVCKIISKIFFQKKFFIHKITYSEHNILSYLFPDKDHLKNFCS